MMRRTKTTSSKFFRHPFPETRNPMWMSHINTTASRGEVEPDAWADPVSKNLATHSNLRPGDATIETNRFMQNAYFEGLETWNRLLGRTTSVDSPGAEYYTAMNPYELSTDLRFKGHDARMARLSYYEPSWNRVIYNSDQNKQHGPFPRTGPAPLTNAAKALKTLKTKTDVEAFWKTLARLIQVHGTAVGDYAPGKARDIRHVHEFFVNFFTAIDGFEHQDAYLKEHLIATRPAELEDLYAVFLRLEANCINPDYCPRCHLHATETHYCGEGEVFTPFRKYRGVPVPHKPWGQEWFGVYQQRAEQLWYRSVEDNHFGTARHTQAQTEGLLKIYCLTKARAKANDFMVRLQGSAEFLDGSITITPEMQRMYDALLDTTPHPTLLTNATALEPNAAKYLGPLGGQAQQSAAQVRVDYEVAKFRRQQREEGTVNVPPAGWTIDMKAVVPYKTENGHVSNWRQVKEGLEASIRATGLPPTAWTAEERREMRYLEWRVQNTPKAAQQQRQQLADERKRATPGQHIEFPDAEGICVFDISAKALGELKHCMPFIALRSTFLDATAVNATTTTSTSYKLDVTDEATQLFGFTSGTVVSIDLPDEGPVDFLVLGVDKSGPAEKWQLIASRVQDPDDVMALGTDIFDVRAKCKGIRVVKRYVDLPSWLTKFRTATEEVSGVIIGARGDVIYAQFDGKTVAMPMGRLSDIGKGKKWQVKQTDGSVGKLVEPFSWNVPFRNDWSQERLEELKRAPWKREAPVPLTPNRYTPKVKRFGYSQHTTQDDFVTKEYKDRLTSKQAFTDSQKFQYFPDATETSVRFAGKNESTIIHGVPAVDRNELENGWDKVPDVPSHEVQAIEQALRDISGRRPGNFIKSPSEKSSLQLTESWWQKFMFGWQQREIADRVLHPAERRAIDKESLPWGGKDPEINSTHGIFERYREIAEDWNRGFDIGPHGYGAHENRAHFDTLQTQSQRAALIGLNNVLARMFDDKLRAEGLSDHAFAISQYCQFTDVAGRTVTTDPKKLIIALNEWRSCGRPPTLLLATVLQSYLANEIAEYNLTLPEGAPRLSIDCSKGVVSLANIPANIWADRDSMENKTLYADSTRMNEISGINEFGYICAVYLEQCCGTIDVSNGSEALQNFRAQLAAQFVAGVSRLIGDGIDYQVMRNTKLAKNASEKGDSTTPLRFINATKLDEFLLSQGLTSDIRSRILGGLKAEAMALIGGHSTGELIPADLVLRWKPSEANAASQQQQRGNTKSTLGGSPTSSSSEGLGRRRDSGVPAMLDALAHNNDGFVMDILYASREDKKNALLRRNFKALFFDGYPPLFGPGDLDAAYDKHCEGTFIPAVEMIVEALPGFIKSAKAAASLKPDDDSPAAERARIAAQILHVHGAAVECQPVPTEAFPFEFENARDAVLSTVLEYRQFGVPLGPDHTDDIPLVTIKSKPTSTQKVTAPDFSYTFDGKSAVVYFDTQTLFGLESKLNAIGITMERSKIAATVNTLLRHCAPLSQRWLKVQAVFSGRGMRDDEVASRNTAALKSIHSRDIDPKIEADFRNNSERYWRSVLEGALRGGQDGAMGGGRGGSNAPTASQRSGSPGKQRHFATFTSGQRQGSPGSSGGQNFKSNQADRQQQSGSPGRTNQQSSSGRPPSGSPGRNPGQQQQGLRRGDQQQRGSPSSKTWSANAPPTQAGGGSITGRPSSPGSGRGHSPR